MPAYPQFHPDSGSLQDTVNLGERLSQMDSICQKTPNKPFHVQDAAELSPAACAVVCGKESDNEELSKPLSRRR